jgi:site-specific recombinase XerD
VHKLVARAGKLAHLKLSVHPHMLRHGKGYQLANKGKDTRAIQAYMLAASSNDGCSHYEHNSANRNESNHVSPILSPISLRLRFTLLAGCTN